MKRLIPLLLLSSALMACAPDTRMPESGYQWERRQERIEREWRDAQAQTQSKTQGAAPAGPAQTSTNGAPAPEDRF
ncbi:hypothetical protein [Brevundimonas sp. SL130]|uniref:hypothetical protein n=1 Tax=Brevundimonas sp. SL130 TaxID=2995143 RepID=UPI00226C81EA|nr:hypothetical protein [Brevundimonas sp. SL130]WAC58916.1 hypothetical protein OU998_11905 [Brevundimonas sp. SL130]